MSYSSILSHMSSVWLKLREYVDDTEDYINIMLDDKQNQLLQMGVMLSTATVVITAGVAVVGLFGMNIGISLYDDPTTEEEKRAANMKFWETTLGTVAGCVILYIVAMGWGKRSGLLQWWQKRSSWLHPKKTRLTKFSNSEIGMQLGT